MSNKVQTSKCNKWDNRRIQIKEFFFLTSYIFILTILIASSRRGLLQEGAGETKRGVATDQVDFKLGLGAHLREFLLLGLRLTLAEVVGVHRVVYVECDCYSEDRDDGFC